MIDRSKRRTLKMISGAGAATMCSFTALASSTGETLDNSALSGDSFSIQIITGKTAIEDTIIFSNHSGADIRITRFLPGMITQNNQMIDLNFLLTNGELTLKHGYPLATKAAKWELLSLSANDSYLWCDCAVSRLPDSDTGIITLNAVVNNGRALLTATHEEVLVS